MALTEQVSNCLRRTLAGPCDALRCCVLPWDAMLASVWANQQVIKGDLKRARVVGIATTQPTSSAGVEGSSGNMLLLVENAPLLYDPGPCPCP